MANIRSPSKRHFEAVGRFIHGCSAIEGNLAALLRAATGIEKDEIARAIIGVGDLRVADTVTILKRVTRITGFDTKNLNRLLLWVTYFNDVRQVIAHKPYYSDGDELLFSNRHTAKSRHLAWDYVCTTVELTNAFDLMSEVAIGLMTVEMQMKGHTDLDFGLIEIPERAPDASLLQKLGLPARPADKRPSTPQ